VTESFIVIIPARLESTRLPEKVLLDIAGKPLIQHVYIAACQSAADKTVIATDSRQVFDIVVAFGAECIMTSPEHTSGTDRLAEVISILGIADDEIIVNLQGDEINMPAPLVNQVAEMLQNDSQCHMATLCEPINDDRDIKDPNIVKVVFAKNNMALYFSRAPIPWRKQVSARHHFRHIGLYAYRAGFLTEFSQMPKCLLEQSESLEQLRALYHGANILVHEACMPAGLGIDTEQDLERARQSFAKTPA
jgi:3-deoxy-manno-octulosonate cytidylyltransferase (CMP-KDO synthetase)